VPYKALDGFSSAIMNYGGTGSGKTYTMVLLKVVFAEEGLLWWAGLATLGSPPRSQNRC